MTNNRNSLSSNSSLFEFCFLNSLDVKSIIDCTLSLSGMSISLQHFGLYATRLLSPLDSPGKNGRRLGIRKGGIKPQESPWKFSSNLPPKPESAYFLLCAFTYTSDFTGGCPPLPLSEKKVSL